MSIDDGSSRTLAEHSLASINGGDIPVRQGTGGDHSLVPESPIYRVLLRPDGGLPAPDQVQRGKVLLEGERESIAGRTLARGAWRAGQGKRVLTVEVFSSTLRFRQWNRSSGLGVCGPEVCETGRIVGALMTSF